MAISTDSAGGSERIALVHGLVRPKGLRLPKAYFVPGDGFGWKATCTLVGVLLVSLGVMPFAVEQYGYISLIPLVPIIGAYSYKLTILMHECCHRTLFRERRMNRHVGMLCGGLLFSSFDAFCQAHWQHHRHCGTHDDGEESDYLTLQHAHTGRLAFHLIKPLLGVPAFAMGWNACRAMVRTAGAPRTPTAAPPGTDVQVGSKKQLAVVAAVQMMVATLATGFWTNPALALVYPASAATFGLFFSRVRAFCEHVRLDRLDGECSVRSHVPNAFDRVFFYTLNMNLHIEHHLFPQVPACHLPRVRTLLTEVGYLQREMSSSSIASTIAAVLRGARARTRGHATHDAH